MAHLWIHESTGEWVVMRLGDGGVALTPQGPQADAGPRDDRGGPDSAAPARAVLTQHQRNNQDTWALAASPDAEVFVNGRPLLLGLRALRDRDEIRVGAGAPCYFSTERLAAVDVFSGTASVTICARCRQEIKQGSPIVRCPACGVVHHQTEELPCWTGYPDTPFATCAVCDQPARLGGSFEWSPASL